jgi:hypothetical protein
MKNKNKNENPVGNSYYWRAVKRLASRKGISIAKARKLNWEKEANAERKRRSVAQQLYPSGRVPPTRRTATPPVPGVHVPRAIQRSEPPRRRTKPPTPTRRKKVPVPSARPKPELKIRDYGRFAPRDEDDYEGEMKFQDKWEVEYADNERYAPLDYLDDIDDALDEWEHEDSDKYKEPA